VDEIVSSSATITVSSSEQRVPIFNQHNSLISESAHLTIYTVMGTKVQSLILQPGQNINNCFNGLAQGFYVLKFIKNDKEFTQGYMHR